MVTFSTANLNSTTSNGCQIYGDTDSGIGPNAIFMVLCPASPSTTYYFEAGNPASSGGVTESVIFAYFT
ncbi:MAG: hypothetical protein ARM1_0590 [Candidatus Micrarchaeota archaeon]|nr:MAG: hypothetical protein ARM1_0590 [Candidatus Micrarchaeota archaeon]